MWLNIHDFVAGKLKSFKNKYALANYTIHANKYYPKREAKAHLYWSNCLPFKPSPNMLLYGANIVQYVMSCMDFLYIFAHGCLKRVTDVTKTFYYVLIYFECI